MRCRRKWDWSSNARMNLTGIGSGPEPLELGGLIHRALADWIIDKDLPDLGTQFVVGEVTKELLGLDEVPTDSQLAQLFVWHASARKTEIEKTWKATTGNDIEPEGLASLMNVTKLGTHMMMNYQKKWKTPFPDNMTFAVAEQEVLVPVPGTEHPCSLCLKLPGKHTKLNYVGDRKFYIVREAISDCEECRGTGWSYHYVSATLDGLLQDKKEDLYVLEHKTYENRPKPIDLYMNFQFTGYCWVVKQLGIGRVGGVAYDGMWKRPEPPKYMQKERRKGTLDDLFIRKILHKSDAEIDEWGRNLTSAINEMANDPVIYPNVPWQGCSDCNFQKVCYMKMMGEDPSNVLKLEFTQREVVRGGK